ncbi:Uncharacterised protein [Mycobacteroides abscessus subsp. abscessus]|nr:Uncharacterised protein [Mycobacteroides abscessus subsp. abscessus]
MGFSDALEPVTARGLPGRKDPIQEELSHVLMAGEVLVPCIVDLLLACLSRRVTVGFLICGGQTHPGVVIIGRIPQQGVLRILKWGELLDNC